MTPQQKLKHAILLKAVKFKDIEPIDVPITKDNVDALYDDQDVDGELQDARNDTRCSGQKTGLPCKYSRHYESDSVAAKMPDGSWVGWIYWYGGGKYGEPDAIDWIEDSYEVKCTEKEQLVVVRTFEKVPQ
jgi:hypothetical protein